MIHDRVTDVLYPYSGLSAIPPNILKTAADRGTIVHELCTGEMNGIGMFQYEPEHKGYVESFLKWHIPSAFHACPQRFYNDELMITGECDGLYTSPNGLALIDLKTSAREGGTWPLQGSAYVHMARQAGYDIKRIEFVKLDKTGKAPKVFVYEEKFDMFLKCLDVYREFFKNSKPVRYADYL